MLCTRKWKGSHSIQTTTSAPDINQVHAALFLSVSKTHTDQFKENLVLDWLRSDCKQSSSRDGNTHHRLCAEWVCVCVFSDGPGFDQVEFAQYCFVVGEFTAPCAEMPKMTRKKSDDIVDEKSLATNCHCQLCPSRWHSPTWIATSVTPQWHARNLLLYAVTYEAWQKGIATNQSIEQVMARLIRLGQIQSVGAHAASASSATSPGAGTVLVSEGRWKDDCESRPGKQRREREGERGISRLDLILEKKEANSSLDSWQHPSLWPVQEQLDTIDPVPFYLPWFLPIFLARLRNQNICSVLTQISEIQLIQERIGDRKLQERETGRKRMKFFMNESNEWEEKWWKLHVPMRHINWVEYRTKFLITSTTLVILLPKTINTHFLFQEIFIYFSPDRRKAGRCIPMPILIKELDE